MALRPPLGGVAAGIELLPNRHRAGMAATRPGGQQQQEPCIGRRANLVTFPWSEFDQQSAATARALAASRGDLNRAINHEQPRALVDLVLGEGLPCCEVECDRARRIARRKDLRQPWLEVKGLEIPSVQPRLLESSRMSAVIAADRSD